MQLFIAFAASIVNDGTRNVNARGTLKALEPWCGVGLAHEEAIPAKQQINARNFQIQ